MTDSKPIRAKSATSYDLLGMDDEKFESMNSRLIRLEFPDARKPANVKDGGADMALPRAGGGYERCWQSKYFCGPINWTKSDKSLASALENWPRISEGCLVELLVQRVVGLAAQHCWAGCQIRRPEAGKRETRGRAQPSAPSG